MAPKITTTVRLVLEALLQVWDDGPTAALYGLEITARAGLLPGTTYPILQRLLDYGWLTDEWEDLDPREAGRPRRRYYRLTEEGALVARKALQDASARLGARSLAQAAPYQNN
ncbi:MAG TPA: helix-turn-helix transcriptional regulator [Pseudonocardiaceae bacterium]